MVDIFIVIVLFKGVVASSLQNERDVQDAALATIGLYRYHIPGDGNCLFRAVASQLNIEQDIHQVLRDASTKWLRQNLDFLLAENLMDLTELEETEAGGWGSNASLWALANVFSVNIQLYVGARVAENEIEVMRPLFTSSNGLIRLAYLHCGHFDAVIDTLNYPNPEYEKWCDLKKRQMAADELLAGILTAGSSITAHSSSLDVVQKLSRSHLLSQIQPLKQVRVF